MLNAIKKLFAPKPKQKTVSEIIHDPELFTEVQRKILKDLFPTKWTHHDNMSRTEMFKIAITMSYMGFPCDTMDHFQRGLVLLGIQKIYIVDPYNPHIIKRG